VSKKRSSRRKIQINLVENSPLRHRDPRVKITLALCASLAVMLPLDKLLLSMVIYIVLLQWGQLLPAALQQVWRIKWILLFLFIGDWLLVDLDLAVIVTLRLILLTGSFALFFATTTPKELELALVRMHIPYRYAFSLGLAFISISLLEQEWQAIKEAQHVRGAWSSKSRGKLIERVRDLVSLAVPAVVLATKRAWSMTEAAHARGFDSPKRKPFHQLVMKRTDFYFIIGTVLVCGGLLYWR